MHNNNNAATNTLNIHNTAIGDRLRLLLLLPLERYTYTTSNMADDNNNNNNEEADHSKKRTLEETIAQEDDGTQGENPSQSEIVWLCLFLGGKC